MEQQRPERFGPYAVFGQIGLGGMGTVYRALDTRLHREVALKVLHRNLEVSGARERFLHEARIVSSLSHPNICIVFDIGEQAEDLYLVMELLRGCSVKDMLAKGPSDSSTILGTALHVAHALKAAHARSVVHRDIKPANLFLTEQGWSGFQVKVLDFGLAKSADAATHRKSSGITRHGATVGTIEYMSPEQACGQDLDGRSDLFSLGAVLYEMATGQAPFAGATSAVIYSHLLNDDPAPLRDANLDLPADLDRILRRLLQKNRDDRYQNATELIEDLEHVRDRADRHTTSFQPPALVFSSAGIVPGEGSSNTPQPPPAELPRSEWDHAGTDWPQRPQVRSATHASASYPVWQPQRATRSPIRMWVRTLLATTMFLLLAITVPAALIQQRPASAGIVTLRVAPLENRTGIATLDSAPTLRLRTEFASTMPLSAEAAEQPASTLAQRPGSHAARSSTLTISGFVANGSSGYVVHLQAENAQSGETIETVEETSPSLEQVPAAVSRATQEIEQALSVPPSKYNLLKR